MPKKRLNFISQKQRKRSLRRMRRKGKGKTQTLHRFALQTIISAPSSSIGVIAVTIQNDPSGLQDWTNVAAMYDMYKVTSIKVQYIPSYPNDVQSVAQYQPAFVFADVDNVAMPGSMTNLVAVQYANCKVVNMARPWKFFVRLPNKTQVAATNVLTQGGFQDCATTSPSAVVCVYGTGFANSLTYGQLIVTEYISAKFRR